MIKTSSMPLCAAFLALMGCGGSSSATGQSTTTPPVAAIPTPAQPDTPTKTTNILFVGGSVTRGSGATTYASSYSQRVLAALEARQRAVRGYNIAVGATTSEFAAYRLDRDLGQFQPDIAVIDFAINDVRDDKQNLISSTDAIIYKLRQRNPQIRIVYAALTATDEETLRRQGSRDPRKDWAESVVTLNNGTFIDAGAELWKDVISGRAAASDFFVDRLHPNDRGHALYADAIVPVLDKIIAAGPSPAQTSSYYIGQSLLDTARMYERDELLTSTSCTKTSSDRHDFWEQQKSYFAQALSCKASETFEIRFTGTSVGFVGLLQPKQVKFTCLLDGVDPINFEQPAADYAYVNLVKRYAADTTHTLKCSADGSIFVGDFLVSRARRLPL